MNHDPKFISGFSKLSKTEKISWLAKKFFSSNPIEAAKEFASFWHDNIEAQELFDGFSENTLTNFYLPYSVAPNFLINEIEYCVPMVTEESSVVAACCKSAKYWMSRGGFNAEVKEMEKLGQIHFYWSGNKDLLFQFFNEEKTNLLETVKPLTENMEQRGGGIKDLELIDYSHIEEGYYQLKLSCDTRDSMGANFINSILEELSKLMIEASDENILLRDGELDVVMSILSNYTPNCVVKCMVECPIEDLGKFPNKIGPQEFAERFEKAILFAKHDVFRTTTHNKGVFNGIDAVVLATGNDFRAVEAAGHAYAARNGRYTSLTDVEIKDGIFKFWIEIPMSIGTVGGLTSLHPLAKRSLQLLGNPNAEELMQIIAATGLAQNFGAIKSLITTGIQRGHMKMHLSNILSQMEATQNEKSLAQEHFFERTISFQAVRDFINNLRLKRSVLPK